MNDDQRLLASAALDGDVTSEERARAEADPAVAAEIDRLRTVRVALQVDTTPDARRREASIAAALAVFDEQPGVAAPPPAAARRQVRWMAPLAAAAAVVVIAVGALVAVQGGGSDDDDLASMSESAATAADSAAGGEAEVAPQVAERDDGADAATEAPEATAGEATGGTSPALTATAPAAASVVTLRSADELAAFARRAIELEETAAPGDTLCATGRSLGTAYYLVDGDPVFVAVVEIAEPHEALAVELERCDVIARAPLP